MQLGFFVTPVIWRVEQLGPQGAWLQGWIALNPLAALLGVLRAPRWLLSWLRAMPSRARSST